MRYIKNILVVLILGLAVNLYGQSPGFPYATSVDVTKDLYGKIPGLNVYQGTGTSSDNISSLLLHSHQPLVIVDGIPRSFKDLSSFDIDSAYVLTDAVSAALYGVRGANGALILTTRRGGKGQRDINIQYNFGVTTPFRKPEFADAATYLSSLNSALESDGFERLAQSKSYPDVDWQQETMEDFGTNHGLKFSYSSGSDRFRHYTSVDFYRDCSLLKKNTTDTRLSLRTNLDLDITKSTFISLGLMASLRESNGSISSTQNIISAVYATPATAFPVRHKNGVYGGNAVYGDKNPVALLMGKGDQRNIRGVLFADLKLKQALDIITTGLSAEIHIAFDNIGVMSETTSKTYSYMDIDSNVYGTDSKTLTHSQPFKALEMNSDFQAKVSYDHQFGNHKLQAAIRYDMQSVMMNGRNRSHRNQSIFADATYSYSGKYFITAALGWSGSSYLPKGGRFNFYPAVSVTWAPLENIRLSASYGLSGWDGNLTHELWRQAYVAGGSYYFGKNVVRASGVSEGALPVINLSPETSERITLTLDTQFFKNRFSFMVRAYGEKRSNVLVSGASSTSGVIGIDIGQASEGEYIYRGFDLSTVWRDCVGDFRYGISANASFLDSEIINENQAYQEYDYLYTKGNKVGQCYGLEAIGHFKDMADISNSYPQTFSTVQPGDIKYKDQNGDKVIDSKDVIKILDSRIPSLYYGFSLNFGYKGFEISADFQGVAGVTVSLLDSPLYMPLVNNGNISQTFLDREIPWTPGNSSKATMPRLTTLPNKNNYQHSSHWYRDGSFMKLRNLVVSYTFPKSMLKFTDMTIFLQGRDLLCVDKIKFADPEQLPAAYPPVRTYLVGLKFNF